MTITYRLVKGSRLTSAEVDENFRTINDAYATVEPAITTIDSKVASATVSANNAASSASAAAVSAGTASNAASTAQAQASAAAASAVDAQNSENSAAASALQSANSATASAASSLNAAASASAAASSASSAFNDRQAAQAAAINALLAAGEASQSATDAQQAYLDTIYQSVINSRFFPSYADAVFNLPSLAENDTFAVLFDETRSGRRTYYKVEGKADASLVIDFMSGYEDVASLSVQSFSADFTSGSFSAFQQPLNVAGVGAFASGFPFTYLGADSINLLSEAPTSSSSAGVRGDFSISGNNFDFHNGTQWVRLTGVTF